MLIGIVLITLTYLVHTRNYVMTLFVLFTFNLILASVINVMRFAAWKVGIPEAVGVSICLCITAFSYSYLVSYYMHAPKEMNKNLKMQYSY